MDSFLHIKHKFRQKCFSHTHFKKKPLEKQYIFLNIIYGYLISSLIYFFIFMVVSAIAQPLLWKKSWYGWLFFSTINGLACHQYEPRCLHLFGFTTGICARCFAFYLGSILTYLACIIASKKRHVSINQKLLFLMLLPLVIDGSTQAILARESNNMLRIVTGIMAGVAVTIRIFSLIESAPKPKGRGFFRRK